MGLVAEYEIRCEALPLVGVAAVVPDATLEVEIVPTTEGYPPLTVHVTAEDPDAVELAFESSAFVDEYSLVGRTGETRLYRVQGAVGMEELLGDHLHDVSALRGLATTDSVVDRIRVTPTGWIQTGWFADRETLEEFRAFWQRNGAFSLRHLGRDGETDESGDGLTDPQREALLVAYEMGYFEIPRAASLGDVAAELDISASSVSERLRRAQTHLVETTVASKRPAATR